MELCELSQVREQVGDLLTSAVPERARLERLYNDLGAAESLMASPMFEAPEESRPVSNLEEWIRDLLREAQGIFEAVPA